MSENREGEKCDRRLEKVGDEGYHNLYPSIITVLLGCTNQEGCHGQDITVLGQIRNSQESL
jgi:hypothetical protein